MSDTTTIISEKKYNTLQYEELMKQVNMELPNLVKEYYLVSTYNNNVPLDMINTDYTIIIEIKKNGENVIKYLRLPFLKSIKYGKHFNDDKILDYNVLFTYLPKFLGMNEYVLHDYQIIDNRKVNSYYYGYFGSRYFY